MDKTKLKDFAIESRKDLMQRIETKIKSFYIEEDFKTSKNGDLYILENNNHTLSLTKEKYDRRELLVKRIDEIGLVNVIEEAAYTWFNRLIAIRYMEINDYLPLTRDNKSLGFRVLSSNDNNPDPEILKFSKLTNQELDIDLKIDIFSNLKNDNEKFQYIILLICKKLGKLIPQVFSGVTDYIDILIPENLLNDTGFVSKLIKNIPEDNFKNVEVIGWLYQYYNQTEKDRVISARKANNKNELAYATQVFTPDWIVKYMVENTLGKYWIEHGGNKALTKNWKYFIDSDIDKKSDTISPEKIKFMDPCSGSGHILVYAFEIFRQIYESAGYSKPEIPSLILKNNIYGLDVDDRAGQLSILSVVLKAREYDSDIFNKKVINSLNILSIQESNSINYQDLDILKENIYNIENIITNDNIDYIYNAYMNGKTIGSLIKLENMDFKSIIDLVEIINSKQLDLFEYMQFENIKNKFVPLLNQSLLLSQKYDIVVTNPPYMNKGIMPLELKNYVFKNYSDYKTDLFSAFIIKVLNMIKENCYTGLMSPYVWMFIGSYENLRSVILNKNIQSLVQLEYSAFDEAVVPICTFVIKNSENKIGNYIRLSDYRGGMQVQEQKYLETIQSKNKDFYTTNSDSFKSIPGMPIAYWLDSNIYQSFKEGSLEDVTIPKAGIVTGDDKFFLKLWYEVKYDDITFNVEKKYSNNKFDKYHLFHKGGPYRRWYGNNEYIIALDKLYDDNCVSQSVRRGDSDYYFKEGVCWSLIGSNQEKSFRLIKNSVQGTANPTLFFKDEKQKYYILGLLNTKFTEMIVNVFNPTLNLLSGDLAKVPYIFDETKLDEINELVKENIRISKEDWDSFETSWDFVKHPFLDKTCRRKKLSETVLLLNEKIKENRNRLKENETKINKIFSEIYNLKDTIQTNITDEELTIRDIDVVRDIKSFISYSIGCMFGRYSLDEEKIVYAGGNFDINKFKSFKPDEDNIIPISSELYFKDDIVSRFKQFVECAFGKEYLLENLDFIAENLGKQNGETTEDAIRRYFINDFYKDHIQNYQKCPIYWQFDSGKKNGFKCLTYIHRYNENLIPKIRLDYLHFMQEAYSKDLNEQNYRLNSADQLSVRTIKEINKKIKDLSEKLKETQEYDEKMAHMANKRIELDLDNGISNNYELLESILAKLK